MTLRETWSNLLDFLENAKILGVFLPLTFLTFLPLPALRNLRRNDRIRSLHLYGSIMTGLCLFVPTAMLLWFYSALHNPYPRIWAMVPILPLTAALLTELVLSLSKGSNDTSKKESRLYLFAGCLGLFVLLLCGNFGAVSPSRISFTGDLKELDLAEETINQLADSDSVIWAPRDLTEYLHRAPTPHRTIYGRDMWDNTLLGFRYDTYSEDIRALYDSMLYIEGATVIVLFDDNMENGILCCNAAKDAGVNVLVFNRREASQDAAFQELAQSISMDLTISDSEESTSPGYYILSAPAVSH